MTDLSGTITALKGCCLLLGLKHESLRDETRILSKDDFTREMAAIEAELNNFQENILRFD